MFLDRENETMDFDEYSLTVKAHLLFYEPIEENKIAYINQGISLKETYKSMTTEKLKAELENLKKEYKKARPQGRDYVLAQKIVIIRGLMQERRASGITMCSRCQKVR